MEYNVRNYGVVADGKTLDTKAFQAAIDDCAKTGGRVIVPTGEYLIGTIWLKSNVELHLCHGARLIGSPDLRYYCKDDAYEQNYSCISEGWGGQHLILCVEQENVAITGSGTVDGSAAAFFGEKRVNPKFYPWRKGIATCAADKPMRPGQMVCFVECKNVTITGINMTNAPSWTCLVHGCKFVQIRGVKIENPNHHCNSDGIDVDTCRYVTISDCIIRTGDDAMTFRADISKMKEHQVCEYVTVSNCVLSSASSVFRVGVGTGVVQHIQVSNIVVESAGVCINFFPEWAGSSHTPIYDVNFSNVSATDVGRMIELNVNNGTPVKNIRLSNITGEAMSAIRMWSTSKNAVENIHLENVDIFAIPDIFTEPSTKPEYRAKSFVWCEGLNDLLFKNCRFLVGRELMPQWENAICIDDCTGVDNSEFTLKVLD